MATKATFISFDYDNDLNYKNLLLAWDKNKEFDFRLYDGSLKDAINSFNAAYIKTVIKPRIAASTNLLCIVGKDSSKSDWIDWEIRTAVDLKKRLIGVKIEKAYTSPAALLSNGATWALSFNFDAIKKAVESA
jgi:hypothetical protein